MIFEYVNGFHDAANAIATVVATRVLTPRQAVIMAGTLNLVGALSGVAVAKTVGSGIVDANVVTQDLVVAALISAIAWDLLTWYYGLPSSSSHALIFSIIGASVAIHGPGVVVIAGLQKTSFGIVYSPAIAFLVGYLLMLGLYWALRNTSFGWVQRFFGKAQILSSAYMAYSHGGNDGQKTMGIIALALAAYGVVPSRRRLLHPGLGEGHLRGRDRCGHDDRRLADHEDDGYTHHQAHSGAGIRGRNDGRHRHRDRDSVWHPHLDDARDLGRDPRRRLHSPSLRGALGHRGTHRHRVGVDDPRLFPHRFRDRPRDACHRGATVTHP